MQRIYIPYKHNQPEPVWVNGHKLIIVTADDDTIEHSDIFDDASIWAKGVEYVEEELESVLGEIALESEAGVVVAPSDLSLEDLIANLEQELPWIQ